MSEIVQKFFFYVCDIRFLVNCLTCLDFLVILQSETNNLNLVAKRREFVENLV